MLLPVVIVLSVFGHTRAEDKCTPEGGICHFLTVPCCPKLTCIRFTRTSGMNGICMLDVHSGDEYNVPLFTPQPEESTPSLPDTTRFTVPPAPTAPTGLTNPTTQHVCCTQTFSC
ncbi:uncharacterized protein LOC144094733 [Amblyomma americanum]